MPQPVTKLSPDQLLQQSFAFHQAGKLDEAENGFRRLLKLYPSNPQLLASLGTILLQKSNLIEGTKTLEKSLKFSKNQPMIFLNLGIAYEKMNQIDNALHAFDNCIKLHPGFHDAIERKGKLLFNLGRFGLAIEVFNSSLGLNPRNAEILNLKAIGLHSLGKDDEAILAYNALISIDSKNPGYFNGKGICEVSLSRFKEALNSFDKSIELNSKNVQPWSNRSFVLYRQNRFEDAIASANQALAIEPQHADAFNNRGLSKQALKHLNEAIADFDECIKLNPQHHEAHWNKALAHLLNGNYEEGWKFYEWRWKSFSKRWARSYKQPLWLGQFPLKNKTILIYPEQGLGDFIQFCRYIPTVVEQGAKVILEAPPALAELCSSLSKSIVVIKTAEKVPYFDYQCPIMSLPLALQNFSEEIPNQTPYLQASPQKIKFWQEKLGESKKVRIGLAWSGSSQHKNNHNRSIPLESFASLLELPFEFHSLQKEVTLDDQEYLENSSIKDHSEVLEDFSNTAALIECMDLVISVDTSIAHLAGALNKKVWILIPTNPDFRWRLNLENTPWYPSARLFRQEIRGKWNSVIEKVCKELSIEKST